MSRRHRPSKADRRPVTRRYVQRVVERARQDIVRAIVAAASIESGCGHAVMNLEPVSPERLASVLDWGDGGRSRSN